MEIVRTAVLYFAQIPALHGCWTPRYILYKLTKHAGRVFFVYRIMVMHVERYCMLRQSSPYG